MTAINISNNEDGRQQDAQRSQSGSERISPSVPALDTSSFLHVEDTMSNASLYCMTPPAYAASAADNEISLDAERVQDEKVGMPGASYDPSYPQAPEGPIQPAPRTSHGSPALAELPASPIASSASSHTQPPPVYLDQLTQDAAITSMQRCSILPARPAVWFVKRRDIALSPLAAAVLLKEGIIKSKDLDLITQSEGLKREPNDPFSGIAFATYDTVGEIMSGLVEGPVQVAKQVTPLLMKHEEERKQKGETPNVRHSVLQESTPLVRRKPVPGGAPIEEEASWNPPQPEADSSSWEPRVWSDAEPQPERRDPVIEAAPNAAKEVAISTGKGLGRIVGAGLKAPMTFTHAVTRGFHNVPKLYGDEVREYENVTDLRSGMAVSAKSFGYGLTDGLKDFFVQPIVGAQKEGGIGFVKGFGKGIGNVVCKPAAGAVGLVSYSFVGVYKELQGLKLSGKDDVAEAMKAQGEIEYSQAPSQTRTEVIKRWCDVSMRQK